MTTRHSHNPTREMDASVSSVSRAESRRLSSDHLKHRVMCSSLQVEKCKLTQRCGFTDNTDSLPSRVLLTDENVSYSTFIRSLSGAWRDLEPPDHRCDPRVSVLKHTFISPALKRGSCDSGECRCWVFRSSCPVSPS